MNGQIANVVFQTTSEPPTIAICINKQNLTHEYIKESRMFSVSVLEQDTPMTFIGRFGFRCGRDFDKFKETAHMKSARGTPIVTEHAVSYLECEVIDGMDLGTHMLFVGNLVGAETLTGSEAMTYDYYHRVKRGKSPRTAPTYTQSEDKVQHEEVIEMEKYKCTVCGYIYDPKNGDPDSGIKPGTPFTEIPDDWVCPVCGVGKDQFERMD